MSIKSRVESQRVRISMNTKHFTVEAGDTQLVQLEDGRYRELPIQSVTFHREGEENESPWTRWYDLSNKEDERAIKLLQDILEKNPHLHDDVNFRVRIVGEFEGYGEPWPGYDDQDAEQIVAYYKASHPSVRPALEQIMQYELGKEETDNAKVSAIEGLDKTQAAQAKNQAGAGVKM